MNNKTIKSIYMNNQFEVTEDMLRGFCKRGMKVKEMADSITQQAQEQGFDAKCSEGQVKKLCKEYGIDLRKKPLKSVFVAVRTNLTQQESKTDNKTVETIQEVTA